MQNLLEELKKLLEQDERLVIEGKLLKNKIIESALKLDVNLIGLLLKSEPIRKHFFQEVDGVLVFDKIKFQKFVSNKAFLPDSYTSFKIEIGFVTENEEYLSESKENVLVWPYKDCVLEGGMEKEDEKRNEIFYNEILAPDEIDRLLEPKVLTSFKRIDKDGEYKVRELKENDNLIIRGNNLLALHSLKKRFARRIKLIYIDPPYNKDSDVFYNDNFKRSTWLTFMKNRLEIARELMTNDGLIFIQIDDAQQPYLKVLCDKIFKNGFINCIVVKSSETSGIKMSHIEKRLPKIKDYILVYKKDSNQKVKLNILKIKKNFYEKDSNYLKYYSKIIKNPEDVVEKWQIIDIDEYIKEENIKIEDANGLIDFKLENASRIVYRTNNKSFEGLRFESSIAEVISSTGIKYIWWEGKQMLFLNDYLSTNLCDLWTDISTINLNKEGGVDLPGGKKPEELIERIIRLVLSKKDIVLDYHLGSGTTCAVAHKMGIQYIGIEQLNYGKNDSVTRIKNVIKGDDSGISENPEINWQGGGDFIYCELMKLNEKYIDKIEKVENTKELLDIWNTMKEKAFLSYKVDIKTVDENVNKFEELDLEKQKKFLIECLDKNQLYINLSEIDDTEYEVTEEDKRLNRQFYGVR